MLPEHRALMHIDQQAKDEGHADADALRLMDAPEHQHERQKVRHPGRAPP